MEGYDFSCTAISWAMLTGSKPKGQLCALMFYFLTYKWTPMLLSRKVDFSSFFEKAVTGLSLCAWKGRRKNSVIPASGKLFSGKLEK